MVSIFCEIHGPNLIMSTILTSNKPLNEILPKIKSELKDDNSRNCSYCKSFEADTFPSLVTFEPNDVTFVSSRSGCGIYETKALKHACMRCLSCESGNKFIICDNLLSGGIVNMNFRVPDSNARGLSRLYSISVMAIGNSKTAIMSSSISQAIYPRFEFIVREVIEREDVSFIAEDKHKVLTFLHMSMVQLLSHICSLCQEFVKFSSSSKSLTNLGILSTTTSWKFYAKTDEFRLMLNDLIKEKTIGIYFQDPKLKDELVSFLAYISLKKISYQWKECVEADDKNCDFIMTSEAVKNTKNKDQEESLSYAQEIADSFGLPNNEATQAKLDLIIHRFTSMLLQWPSKVTPAFLRSKKVQKADIEWCEKLLHR